MADQIDQIQEMNERIDATHKKVMRLSELTGPLEAHNSQSKTKIDNPVIQRELDHQCLRCGKDIFNLIANPSKRERYTIHLCKKCRKETHAIIMDGT